MKRVEKIFIGIGVLLILLLCAGIYVNYQLDHLVASLNRPGLLFVEVEPGESEGSMDGLEVGSEADTETGTSVVTGTPAVSAGGQSGRSSGTGASSSVGANPSSSKISGDVQAKIDKPIEKGDLIKAGLIILRKLDADEISFLYRVGREDHYTAEELKKTRAVLLNKLSPEDVETLRQLGVKYGKQLRILDPEVEIE